MNFIKKIIKQNKSKKEKFNKLSFKDRLEYYERFKNNYFVFSNLNLFIFFILLSFLNVFCIMVIYLIPQLFYLQETIKPLILSLIFYNKLLLFIFVISFISDMIIYIYKLDKRNKWLKEKGIEYGNH